MDAVDVPERTVRVAGIDPGQNGAIAVLDDEDGIITCVDMPTADGSVSPVLVHRTLAGHGHLDLVVIENVHSMPKQGVASSFKFGRSKGVLEGVTAALRVPVEMPTASVWKRSLGVTADKDSSRAKALELWPDAADLLARKRDADRAEALLLAEYGRRVLASRRVA